MCWIALVQRYNYPCQVLNKGQPVANISDVASVPNIDRSLEMNDGDIDQLVTVGISDDSEVATSVDFSTIEHVQCCGHQVLMASSSYRILYALRLFLYVYSHDVGFPYGFVGFR